MPVRLLATAGTVADCTRAAAWNCSGYTAEAEPEGGVEWRRVMPGMRRRTWQFTGYVPWRCGPK